MSQQEQIVPLIEITRSTSLRVDREAGVIRGVKVLGLASANGRRYALAAIERARPLYEGIPVNIDHPHPARPDERRRLGDRLGRLENVRATDAGLFADLHYLKSHPLAEMTVEAAERMPEALGLSHNAVGRVVVRQQETIVEEIMQVRSVDVVSDPATTKSLFEGESRTDFNPFPERNEFRSTTKSLFEGSGQGSVVGGQDRHPGPLPEYREREKSAAELQEELAGLRRREEVRELLDAAEIPAVAPLVEALALIESSEARQALIAAWPRMSRSASRPQSQGRVAGSGGAGSGDPRTTGTAAEVAAFLRGDVRK